MLCIELRYHFALCRQLRWRLLTRRCIKGLPQLLWYLPFSFLWTCACSRCLCTPSFFYPAGTSIYWSGQIMLGRLACIFCMRLAVSKQDVLNLCTLTNGTHHTIDGILSGNVCVLMRNSFSVFCVNFVVSVVKGFVWDVVVLILSIFPQRRQCTLVDWHLISYSAHIHGQSP